MNKNKFVVSKRTPQMSQAAKKTARANMVPKPAPSGLRKGGGGG